MTVPGFLSKGLNPDLTLSGSGLTYNSDSLKDYKKRQPVFNAAYVNQYSTRSLKIKSTDILSAKDVYNAAANHTQLRLELDNNSPDRQGSGYSTRSNSRGSGSHLRNGFIQRMSSTSNSLSGSPRSGRSHIESHLQHEKDYIEMALNLKRFKQQPPGGNTQQENTVAKPIKLFHESQTPRNHIEKSEKLVRCKSEHLDKDEKLSTQDFLDLISQRCTSVDSEKMHQSAIEQSPSNLGQVLPEPPPDTARSKRSSPGRVESPSSVNSIVADLVHSILLEENIPISPPEPSSNDHAALDQIDLQSLKKKSRKKKKRSGKKSRLKNKRSDKEKSETESPYGHVSSMVMHERPSRLEKTVEMDQLQAFVKPMQVLPANPKKLVKQLSVTYPKDSRTRMSLPHPVTHRLSHTLQAANQKPSSTLQTSQVSLSLASSLNVMPRRSLSQVTGSLRQVGDVSRLKAAALAEAQLGRLVKVFLSERQSGMLTESGLEFPCAPPTTPMPDMLRRYEYIPSMNDIRSQRAVKVQLESMKKHEKQKKEKLHEEKLKQDRINEKLQEKSNKIRQRREIYLLNKMMTELENKNFQIFVETNGLRNKKR